MLKASILLVAEQIIFDDEIYHTHHRLTEGLDASLDGLALDVIVDVGPGGHFLAQKHTRRHLREIWIMDSAIDSATAIAGRYTSAPYSPAGQGRV